MKISTKQIQFLKYRWYFISVSILIIAATSFYMIKNGLNYGIDFRGGVKLTVRFVDKTSDGIISEALSKEGFNAMVQKLGSEKDELFTIKTIQTEASLSDTVAKVMSALTKNYGEGKFSIESEQTVGPKVGKELRKKGFLAVIFTLLAILIYLAFRFDINFAPGAIVALGHDVMITLGISALLGVEFNLTILAVILTIVGYSVNDTIVIFDRIRENIKRISPSTLAEVVNECINVTLSRTIITSLTVLIVVIILYFFGGGEIHDFALTFIIGLIAGTYSTIFIASPVYMFMYRHWPRVSSMLGFKTAR